MTSVNNIFKNEYVITLLSAIILIHSANLGNKISRPYNKIFNHYIFTILFLLLLLYIICHDKKLGFIMAIAFIIVNQTITNNMVFNNLNQLNNFIKLEHFTKNI